MIPDRDDLPFDPNTNIAGSRRRFTFQVTVNLDDVPGTFYRPEDYIKLLSNGNADPVLPPWYNPVVEPITPEAAAWALYKQWGADERARFFREINRPVLNPDDIPF